MGKTSQIGEKTKMSKHVCLNVSATGRAALEQSVERLISQNKKVFDNLAKS